MRIELMDMERWKGMAVKKEEVSKGVMLLCMDVMLL